MPLAAKPQYQLKLFEVNDPLSEKILNLLDKIDVDRLSPVEALLKLIELKEVCKNIKR